MNLSPGAPSPAIQTRDLTVVRSKRLVLDRLTLDVRQGSITGLIGPSGCGKTTLIRCLAGVQLIRSGTVQVLGQPAGHAALRSRVCYMTQASSVYPDLTVQQNLRYYAALAGTGDSEIEAALTDVDLTDHRLALTGNLSGGQRTRVSLAVALVGQPELLLLDEPTVGLDPVLRRDLWQLFSRLATEGRTLLVTSHVMDEAARCEQVLLMRSGRLIAEGSPAELRDSTGKQDLEQAFLQLAERQAS
ncbi:MAG TPA: ABC transporter ATP-binding protein [Jatrophihabitans sp.]|nr:ABC transporter ATP-binding protein [Jatrophihabitans sp.]